MTITREAFDKVIAPGLTTTYIDAYEALPSTYDTVFKVTTTQRAYEDALITAGLGTTPVKPESVDVAMDRPLSVGTVRIAVVSYGLGYELSQELLDDDLYGIVGKPASRYLAESGRDTEERQAWALLNGAFTTTKSYDGVSIINASHVLAGGGTYGNAPASAQAFGFTSLQASLERQMLMVNERGLRIRSTADILVVPVQLSWLAEEILGSASKPFTSDNTPNVLARNRVGLRVVSSPYLTSATAWFVLANNHKLMFFWRKRPYMDNDYDKKAQTASFMNFFRFGTGAFDWRGVDGSTG
jgi:hypothetical protein